MPLLSLLRHGLAETDRSDPGLSTEGVGLMQEEARGMARLGLRFDTILSSPLKRAQQTARIVADGLSFRGEVRTLSALEPGFHLSGLRRLTIGQSALLVGHAPDMGKVAAELIGAASPLMLSQGSLCTIELASWPAGGPGRLVFLLPAEILAALGSRQAET